MLSQSSSVRTADLPRLTDATQYLRTVITVLQPLRRLRNVALALLLTALGAVFSSNEVSAASREEKAEALLSLVRETGPLAARLASSTTALHEVETQLADDSRRLGEMLPDLEARVQQARRLAVSVYIDGDASLRMAALSAADDPLQYAARLALISPTAEVQALDLQPVADKVSALRQRVENLTEARTKLLSETSEMRVAYEDSREQLARLAQSLTRDTDVSVLGPSLLTAEELTAFLMARSPSVWPLPVSRLELARMYVDEAAAEGVRGDLLMIQAVMETGWFRFESGLSEADHYNFAGINACDSCRSASRFESVRMGVRAHVQLVKSYADEELTSKNTALPYAYKVENIPVRGCCVMFSQLGGYWASAHNYYKRVLWTWATALEFSGHRAPWE
jgi:hypothetical protein